MSNPAMPGIVKIGESNNIPRRLKKEANKPDTWKPPYPYKVEFVLKTLDHKLKEKDIHTFLDRQGKRICGGMNKEFWSTTPEEVLPLFRLMDGEFIDGETFLLLTQQQFNDSEEDDIDELSESAVTTAISEISKDNIDFEEQTESRFRTFERYDYNDGVFNDWCKRKRASYKSIRRDNQGLNHPIFTSVASKQGLRTWADWNVDKMSFVLKENYPWITPEIRAVLKDCFP
jgi:hypothetical protein